MYEEELELDADALPFYQNKYMYKDELELGPCHSQKDVLSNSLR